MAGVPPPAYNTQAPPSYPPGAQPPPAAYAPSAYPQPAAPAQPQAANTTVVVQTQAGSCPHCGLGYRTENYTCCGIALAILFFPLGLICCLLMKESRCSHCGRPM